MSWALRLKKAISFGIYQADWRNTIISRIKNRGGLILAYHRVLIRPEDEVYPVQDGMYVTQDDLVKHFAFLSHNFDVVSLDRMITLVNNGHEEELKGKCSITFDDGWRDNYQNAFSVIRDFKMPVTIFLSVHHIDTGETFWPEKINYLFQKMSLKTLQEFCSQNHLSIDLNKSIQKREIDPLIEQLKRMNDKEREDFYRKLLRQSKLGLPKIRLLMNWNEILEMQSSGVIFGSHSLNHKILTSLSKKQAYTEINDSYEILKKRGVRPATVFCYPNGDYNKELIDLVKKAGYSGAVTLGNGYITSDADLFALGRIPMHHDVSSTIPLFTSRLMWRKIF